MVPDSERWPQLAAAFARLGRPVVVVDLETTGGHLLEDRVTEVALLRFHQGKVTRHQWLVNPERPITPFITGLTGISSEMVADAPVFAQLADELLPLLRGAVVVAHNSRFDYTFLRHEFHRSGRDFAAPALCTVQLSRRLYPQFHKHNLDSIIERSDIRVESRHRAMPDVLALADFLELAVKDAGPQGFDEGVRALMSPKMLPTWLPAALADCLEALPDSSGVLVWLDKNGQALQLEGFEKVFSGVAAKLARKMPLWAQAAASVRFEPALGPLHMLWQKAQLAEQYGVLPPPDGVRHYLTVRFHPNERGQLQARLVPLRHGAHAEHPFGLFVHKKAAKRALSEWGAQFSLCPAALNILPDGHAKGVMCPVQAVGLCDGKCQTRAGVNKQNERVLQQASALPVADWGRAHEVEVVETDALSGRQVTLRCAGGALALPDGRWYFDDALPVVLKAKFKLGKTVVRVLR